MDYKLKSPENKDLTLIEQIFTNRGMKIEDIDHYLHTSKEDIYSPTLLDNITEGAKMLVRHIAANDDIFVQVDSDCDGATSAALLINYLYMHFPAFVQNHIFYRLHTGKQHGIIPSTINDSIKLVIAPDSSSNDYEEHKELKNRGIDILVLDHHEADHISEYACIINNQLCDYPTKSLSGVGVVYKFCCYLDSLLPKAEYSADNFLDLVAVGMIGDMMDLRDFETKELISEGLSNIQNPFIAAVKELQNYSINKHGYFDPFAVAFYIVPLINSMFRSGTAEERLLMFEAMLHYKAYEQIPSTKRGCNGQLESRVDQAARTCKNVKSRQTRTNDSLLDIVYAIIDSKNLLTHKMLIVPMEDEITNRNLTGLLANQLADEYQRPVLILNHLYNEETDTWTWEGSGRNYSNSCIEDLRQTILQSNLLLYAEGHANAFGVGITEDNLSKFIEYIDNAFADYDFHIQYLVDKIYEKGNFNPKDILDIANLKPLWGQNLPEPVIAIEHLAVHKGNVTLRSPDKNPTLVIQLTNGVELIKFGAELEEYQMFDDVGNGCIFINIVGTCDRNIWNSTITPQIKLEDYEVVSRNEYYF